MRISLRERPLVELCIQCIKPVSRSANQQPPSPPTPIPTGVAAITPGQQDTFATVVPSLFAFSYTVPSAFTVGV